MSVLTPKPLPIHAIQQRISPFQARLAHHPLYSNIQTLAQLRLFMESHVFAVWDFMSLLKSLQRQLTSVELPWVPSAHPASRRFINEIVLGEESDLYNGRPLSHFELYREAMLRAGARTAAIDHLLAAAKHAYPGDLASVLHALEHAPAPAQRFVQSTFGFIHHSSTAAQAAAFTFGREDAIPDMFRLLVKELNRSMDGDLGPFLWYLERHIEVDGDDHGPLALQMVSDLCGTSDPLWEEAAEAAENALRARLLLWDGIAEQIAQAA